MPGDYESADRTTQLDLRDPWLNTTIDRRYRLTRVIGEGGMGMVYEAVQLSMDRLVAIKLLRSDDETNRRRLLREVRLLTLLEHPNIVHVLDGGETESGAVFLVMERLVGQTLADKLAVDRLGWRDAAALAVQLCDALVASHAQGIVHRDLKPGNIMLVDEPTRGELVKVLDFGIAKALIHETSRNSQLTLAGMIIGTPHYMAPEAIEGELDPRSDLYALGSILYEMLGGAAPFAHANLDAVLWHQLRESPPPLQVEMPHALGVLVYALLAKQPEQRPRSAAVVRDELLAILVPPPAITRFPVAMPPPVHWVMPVIVLLGLMLVAFVVTLRCA
jgi:eukaryotic-like serine/threonine-protein kinase